MYTVGIITSSDKGAKNERIDKSGEAIKEIVEKYNMKVMKYLILPDERKLLSEEMKNMSDILKLNLVLTTGGTGFSIRDVTPEATRDIIEREVPGIPEAIRQYSINITKRAMLSRAIAGIRKETLIVNLKGSEKSLGESLEYSIESIIHVIDIITGSATECAR